MSDTSIYISAPITITVPVSSDLAKSPMGKNEEPVVTESEAKAPSPNVIEIPAGASIYLNAVEIKGRAYVTIGADGVIIIPAASSTPPQTEGN